MQLDTNTGNETVYETCCNNELVPANEEEYVESLSQHYNIPVDYIPCMLARDFDFQKCNFFGQTPNSETTILVANNSKELIVSTQLKSIMTILNQDKIVAPGSIHRNHFGYSSICFTLDGFQQWVNRLIEAAFRKHKTNVHILPIVNRFCCSIIQQQNIYSKLQKQETNFLYLSSNVEPKSSSFELMIYWNFLPSDIDLIFEQLNDLEL